MVYYEPPKRNNVKRPLASLASLADETLLQIFKELDSAIITNLRITNSNFTGACNTILAKRNTILYIHPTTSSLRQAVDICGHPIFREHIQEIVLLGKIPWRDIETTIPGVRSSKCADSITSRSLKGRFCSWPYRPYSRYDIFQNSESIVYYEFERAYELLLSALASLPSAQAVSFSSGVQVTGWNRTSQKVIDSHAKKSTLPPASRMQQLRHADADAVFGVVSALGPKITSLRLDSDLPFAGPATQALRQLCGGTSAGRASSALLRVGGIRKLTSIDLVLDIGTRNEEHALQRGLIACAAPVLQHLKLTLVPQHARAQAAAQYDDLLMLSISDILSFGGDKMTSRSLDCYFKRLESLTLEYRDPPVPAKCRDVRRRVRPSCQVLDLSPLLDRVRYTIRHVTINNIIFPPLAQVGLGNPKDTNLKIHQAIIAEDGMAYPNLEHFEWRINRYEHDPRCRSEGGRTNHRDCDKLLCGWYLPSCTLEMYEQVAETLGAELKARRDGAGSRYGSWDFGAAIMRARQAALNFREVCESAHVARNDPKCEGCR